MSATVFAENPAVSVDEAFEIQFDRERGQAYMCCTLCWLLPLASSGLCLPCVPFIPCWVKKEMDSVQCKVTDRRIEFQGGYLNRVSKQIPLDRVQDVAVNEGCCQRMFGVKSIDIQTAGSAKPTAELTLNAPKDAEMVRDLILQRRDRLVLGAGASGAASGAGVDGIHKVASTSKTSAVSAMTPIVPIHVAPVGSSEAAVGPIVLELRELRQSVQRIEGRLAEGLEKMDKR
ncbi:hypothetical protein PINS_up003062 [Pythium insidiosum]|nr:hypothetical protein PINS_up003062 [Pythium insidiosum]